MKLSKEYMSFLEAHRQVVEFKDKLKQAANRAMEEKVEQSVKA